MHDIMQHVIRKCTAINLTLLAVMVFVFFNTSQSLIEVDGVVLTFDLCAPKSNQSFQVQVRVRKQI